MSQPAIQFYHLLTTPLEQALPKLMERALASDMRVVVKAPEARIAELNRALWAADAESFLPHGSAKDANPERQPIYLTDKDENPNDAALLVIADGSDAPQEGYDRVFDVFDGAKEEEVAAARTRWKTYLDAGSPLKYIRQKDDGGWEILKEENQST